jgi:hypothetical protein
MIPALIEVANLLATSPFIPPNLQGALLLSSSILVIFFRAFSQGSQLTMLPKKVEEISETVETVIDTVDNISKTKLERDAPCKPDLKKKLKSLFN